MVTFKSLGSRPRSLKCQVPLFYIAVVLCTGCGTNMPLREPLLVFSPVISHAFGDAPFSVNAQSQSSAPITYSVLAGPATIAENIVTLQGAGTITIEAMQGATGDYTSAIATLSFLANPEPANLLVTAIPDHVYGDPPFTIAASSGSGAPISLTIGSGPATMKGDTISLLGAGEVTVVASQSAQGNFAAQSVSTSFLVAKAVPLLAFASIPSQVYGAPPFHVMATSASLGAVTYSVQSGPAHLIEDEVTTIGAGEVTLLASQSTDANYTAQSTSTVVVVGRANPSLVFSPIGSPAYGDPPIPVSAESPCTGAIAYSILSGPASISNNLLTFTSEGTVDLQAAQAGDHNYNPATATVTFTVEAPTISISPAILKGGPVSIGVSGKGFAAGSTVVMDGKPLVSQVSSSTLIQASGFLPPWKASSVLLQVYGPGGLNLIAQRPVPIAPTAVTYDAAARFTTQAAFGPRPDLVEHIQAIGFDAFITEQFQQPTVSYDPVAENSSFTFIKATSQSNSLLRMRAAWAFQNIFVPQGGSPPGLSVPIERTFESYANLNFRDLMTAVVSDANIGWFLDLINNNAPTDPSLHPNQNFGRELMQLFTLGPNLLNNDGSEQVDASGNSIPTYDLDTVVGVTRAFTGWTVPVVVNPDYTFWGTDYSQPLRGVEAQHDHQEKVIFGSTVLPAGQTIEQDRDAVLDTIFSHPNLPPYISRLLIQHMVNSDPSGAFVERIANVFQDNGSGVRGDLDRVLRAILLDPEARLGDTSPSAGDGFIQDPILFQTFAQNVLQIPLNGQSVWLSKLSGEEFWHAATVFGFYDPAYRIPGTSINSPEFMLFDNVSLIQRSQFLWAIINAKQPGFGDWLTNSWLMNNFSTVVDMVDALNHLLYHGTMSDAERELIINYCNELNPYLPVEQLKSAIFLAMNSDAYVVAH